MARPIPFALVTVTYSFSVLLRRHLRQPGRDKLRGRPTPPSPAIAAARSPLKLPLVQATRQRRPTASSTASARWRVMLGGG